MRDNLYIATFSSDALEVAKENKLNIEVDDLCISENLNEENMRITRSKIRDEIEKSGSGKTIYHGPFTELYPAGIDKRAVDFAETRFESAYALLNDLGGNRMVVHSGYLPFIYFKEWQSGKSAIFWQRFMDGKKQDFQLYVENVLEDEPYSLKNMMEQIEDSRIGLCLDLGHANAMAKDVSTYEWIKVLGPYVRHFHIHNNDGTGDSHEEIFTPGAGRIDYEKAFGIIKDYCSEDVTFTIESHACNDTVKQLKERGYI